MKTNDINLESLLKQKFEDAQISPPEHIWQNVEKSIPHYIYYVNYKAFILNTIVILIGIGLISLSVVYSNKEQINKEKGNAFQIIQQPDTLKFAIYGPIKEIHRNDIKRHININQKTPVNIRTEETSSQKSQITQEEEEKTIYLEATKYKNVITIEIFNDSNLLLKKIENPVINEYGYYEIKINTEKNNHLKIKLYTREGKVILNEMNL